jgi:CheY-like chemotaxis protein
MTISEGQNAPTDGRKPSYRILVVDDEDNDRELYSRILKRAGYDVVGTVDGEAAWEAIQAQHFDLMITDNSMPKVTGIELINKLHVTGLKLETVLLTGGFPDYQLDRYPWLRDTVILTKPLENREILSVVEKILNKIR